MRVLLPNDDRRLISVHLVYMAVIQINTWKIDERQTYLQTQPFLELNFNFQLKSIKETISGRDNGVERWIKNGRGETSVCVFLSLFPSNRWLINWGHLFTDGVWRSASFQQEEI